MNEQQKRDRKDFLQNIIIVLLSVSAVLLFAQTQIYNLGVSGGSSWFLSAAESQSSSGISDQDTLLTAPVQVAVTGPYGRFGSVTLTTAHDSFAPLRALLGQALGSARTYTACDQSSFLNALRRTSVYCDFHAPLPLTVLSDLLWTSGGDEDILAQRVIVAEQDGKVVLYLWDDGETYLRCDTALSPGDLAETVNLYELGNAQFAFDGVSSERKDISPFSLFLNVEPTLPVLSCSSTSPNTSLLLSALEFNPNTQNRYLDTNGTEVVREGERTLRIGTDSTATYQSGGDAALSINAEEETPTALEAVTGTAALLTTLLSSSGDANIYLEAVHQSGTITTLRFGYQVGGIPIRFSDGQSAAEITLSGASVSSMTVRFRQYAATEETSLLLPLKQALAIAAQHSGAELSIGYVDSGTGTVSAQWLAD